MRRKTDEPGRSGRESRAEPHSTGLSSERIGLCASCCWLRKQESRRGAVFLRCLRANRDAAYLRYPPIPVLRCPGHELSRGPAAPQ